jgi:hypothetical protein
VVPAFIHIRGLEGAAVWVPSRVMGTALRPIGHLTAWLVWHAMRVSLLEDLDQPRPPHSA